MRIDSRLSCIASRQRGAWIETGDLAGAVDNVIGIASRQRGAWIETTLMVCGMPCHRGIASRQRGAWIETPKHVIQAMLNNASPPGNGGRGLKQVIKEAKQIAKEHRLPATGGVD